MRLLLIFFLLQLYLTACVLAGQARTDIPYWERTGRRALTEVNLDWKAVLGEWTIEFHPGRKNLLGLATRSKRRVDIWIRPAQTPKKVAASIVHELAHVFDHRMTPDMRKEWLKERHLPPDTHWYFPVGPMASDYFSGAGDFAECVSRTFQGPVIRFQSQLGPPPNAEQRALIHRWFAPFIKTAGK